jgi:hypothetical protein
LATTQIPKLGGSYNVPQDQWKEGIFSGTHGSYWDKDGNLYVQDWNVSGRLMNFPNIISKSTNVTCGIECDFGPTGQPFP